MLLNIDIADLSGILVTLSHFQEKLVFTVKLLFLTNPVLFFSLFFLTKINSQVLVLSESSFKDFRTHEYDR